MSNIINYKIQKVETFGVKEKMEKNKTTLREFSVVNAMDFDTFKSNVQIF